VLIIFGLTSRDHLVGTISVVCERCGYQGAHHVTKRVRRFSVFFIPLIPLGTSYADTCTVCGRVLSITREQANRAIATGSLR
jgi:zinc-ribbon family